MVRHAYNIITINEQVVMGEDEADDWDEDGMPGFGAWRVGFDRGY